MWFFQLTIDWTPVVAYERHANIVARISNRVFVGLPLCISLSNHLILGRNKDYLNVMTSYALSVIKAVNILRPFPQFLKPYFIYLPLLTSAFSFIFSGTFEMENRKQWRGWRQ